MELKSDEKYDKFNRIQFIVDFIEKNYAQDHSVEFYADTCKMAKHYFIKLFGEYTGVSPHLYKTKIRMEKAKELLKNTKNDQFSNCRANWIFDSLLVQPYF